MCCISIYIYGSLRKYPHHQFSSVISRHHHHHHHHLNENNPKTDYTKVIRYKSNNQTQGRSQAASFRRALTCSLDVTLGELGLQLFFGEVEVMESDL